MEQYLLSLAVHLDPGIFQSLIVPLGPEGPLGAEARKAGIPVQAVPMSSRLDMRPIGFSLGCYTMRRLIPPCEGFVTLCSIS